MSRFRGVRSPLIRGNERKRDIWDCEALCVSLREAVFSKLCRVTVTIRHMATIRPFMKNAKSSTCTDNCPWGKRALRGRVNSARFPRRSATLMLNAGTMTH